MAYQVPPRWQHSGAESDLNRPVAASMNKYSDAIVYLYNIANDTRLAIENTSGDTVRIYHRWRWLWYESTSGSTATIIDPSGTNSDMTLPDVTTMTAYDLSQVDWLSEGQVYELTGAEFVAEDYQG